MMTKRIFRAIFLVALTVFLAGTALVMGARRPPHHLDCRGRRRPL